MQVIVIGAGKVGSTVAVQLAREGHGVTVIEPNRRALDSVMQEADVAGVEGSGSDRTVLEDAGVATADLALALTGSDEQNLLTCLLAKKLGTVSTIARVRNPVYSGQLGIIADDLGLSMSVNPEKETAMEIARILEFPLAKKVETFAGGKVELVDYDVTAQSPMCGREVKDVFSGVRSALVCAVERDGEAYIPRGDFRFKEGDVMTLVAPAGELAGFFRSFGIRFSGTKRVLICGGGRVSFYLAQQLLRQKMSVTIIERDQAEARSLSEALPGAVVVLGDGTDQALLDEEGLRQMDAFCCLTGGDEENILTALYAKSAAPGIKTVAKINRVEIVSLVEPLGLGSVVSPKLIAADRLVSYVRARHNGAGSGVLTLYNLVGGKAEALEFKVAAGSPMIGVPISELKLKANVVLACINRGGRIISPRGSDALQQGDTVVVVTTITGLGVLDDIRR